MTKSKKPGWVDWRKCAARTIMLKDAKDGFLSGKEYTQEFSAAAFEAYKERPEFANVVFSQFDARLRDYLKKGSKKAATGTKASKKKPSNSGWIEWRKSDARVIMLQDAEEGFLVGKEYTETFSKQAFQVYKKMDEFVKVVFSQFDARLKDYLKNGKAAAARSARDDKAMQAFRMHHPKRLFNRHGQRVFYTSAAKQLLHQDIEEERQHILTPQELHESHPEYKKFDLDTFRRAIGLHLLFYPW